MNNTVKANDKIEKEIEEYRREKTRQYKKAWIKKRIEKEPDYFRKYHIKNKENNRKQEKIYRKKTLHSMPKSLTDDMKEWKRRRCLEYKDIAERLGIKENYLHGMMTRRHIPSKALLKLCGLKYDFKDPDHKYEKFYTSKKYKSYSICTDCNTDSCPWHKSFKPVEGWNAKPTKITNDGCVIDSYKVFGCPLYTDIQKEENDGDC